MNKNTLHTILAFSLVFIFQLPTWIQFEHSFHKHEKIRICNAKGSDRHIHKAFDDTCKDLHKIINPNLHIVIFEYQKSISISQYEQRNHKTINISKQLIPHSDLRAPPNYIL